MTATRAEVYEAVDSERAYQGTLERNVIKDIRPLEHIAIIEKIIADLKNDYYHNPGPVDLNYIRKIAATAVRVMEEHGAPKRAA
jgi:hypothetical protein